MLFTSINFLLFLPLVIALYTITPAKYKWLTLLIISYVFYLNIKPIYALLTVGVTVSTYTFTRLMDNSKKDSFRKRYMMINIVLILLPLLYFKYFSVINNELLIYLGSRGFNWIFPEMKYLLPIGISYYTFMCIGYTIDVYNEEIKAEKNIGIVALFVSFFPLILSGPIERAKNMLPQFRNLKSINLLNIKQGAQLMLWGYFMKLVVADRIGMYVDVVYNNLHSESGNSILLAVILYPFQVYADLGGYSLLAIGIAKTLGIDVMHNFKRPFFAITVADFWRRWHISLIKWLTDYLYTPLSFSLRKLGIWGIIIALQLTFLISGIWHYASLSMVIWGVLQGTYLSIEAFSHKQKTEFENKYGLRNRKWYLFISMLLTFSLFAISQIVGRTDSIADSALVFTKIFSPWGNLYLDLTTLLFSIVGIVIVLCKDFVEEFYPNSIRLFSNTNILIRYSSYLSIVFLIILFGVLDGNSFIYFQF